MLRTFACFVALGVLGHVPVYSVTRADSAVHYSGVSYPSLQGFSSIKYERGFNLRK